MLSSPASTENNMEIPPNFTKANTYLEEIMEQFKV